MPRIVVADTFEIDTFEETQLRNVLTRLVDRWTFSDAILPKLGAKVDVTPVGRRLVGWTLYKFPFNFGPREITWYTIFTNTAQLYLSLTGDQLVLLNRPENRPLTAVKLRDLTGLRWQSWTPQNSSGRVWEEQLKLINRDLRGFLRKIRDEFNNQSIALGLDTQTRLDYSTAAMNISNFLDTEREKPSL